MLRYLFSNLIDEEIKRDGAFLENLLNSQRVADLRIPDRMNPPTSIQMPQTTAFGGWNSTISGPISAATVRASNGFHIPIQTPGLAIGFATPGIVPPSGVNHNNSYFTPTLDDGSQLERTQTQRSNPSEQPDYFSKPPTTNGKSQGAAAGGESGPDNNPPQSPAAEDTPTAKKAKGGLFSKKGFNKTFNMKKFGSGLAANTAVDAPKPPPTDDKGDDSDSRSNKTDERPFEDNFFGVIQKIRQLYEDQVTLGASRVETRIVPSLPNDTPVLKPPASTTILIQEDRPDSGGVADLFAGEVGSLGRQADLIEKVAPLWLGEVLLRVRIVVFSSFDFSFLLLLLAISTQHGFSLLAPPSKND